MSSSGRAALGGAAAALVWAAAELVDRRLLRHDYSDVALLGKFVTRSRWWPLAGLAVHAANGAVFGLAYHHVLRRTRTAEPRRLALQLALLEHVTLFPLGYVVDRVHPARGERGLASLFSARAFAQASLRHALFGAALGRFSS
jgi:hypothetical protein